MCGAVTQVGIKGQLNPRAPGLHPPQLHLLLHHHHQNHKEHHQHHHHHHQLNQQQQQQSEVRPEEVRGMCKLPGNVDLFLEGDNVDGDDCVWGSSGALNLQQQQHQQQICGGCQQGGQGMAHPPL